METTPRRDEDGRSCDHVVAAAEDGKRLVDVGRAHLGMVARRVIGPLIASGDLLVDGATARIADPVRQGQRLHLATGVLERLASDRLTTPPSNKPLTVVHEDADLIVVDKPAGIHVHPMGVHRQDTVLGRVLHRVGARHDQPWTTCAPAPAHRLDRPTSGLLAFARHRSARDRLQQALEDGDIVRTYMAILDGDLAPDSGTIELALAKDPDNPLRQRPTPVHAGGKPARSHWTVTSRTEQTTTVRLTLDTGRTHQLRAHMASLGTPIVGDVNYGGPRAEPAQHIALRAVSLRLPHPRTGEPLHLRVPASSGALFP